MVDHIVLLKHHLVAGLHHEDNLQILTRAENDRKLNSFRPFEIINSEDLLWKEAAE